MNYIEHLLILVFAVAENVSISALASLVDTFIGIARFALELKNFPYNCGIKKYKPIITKLRKEHDKIVLLAKTKLNITGILISKDLLDSYISHDEFFPATNALKKYDDLKEAIKNPKAISKYV